MFFKVTRELVGKGFHADHLLVRLKEREKAQYLELQKKN